MHIPRTPSNTDLHKIIRENYRQVFFDKENDGTNLPFHLEREFRKYLNCGNLAYGMARFHCSVCQKDKLVAFSCKGRTLCPSCTGRRMASTAKHLVEEVIPEVPIRQWVLSMPYTHRFLLATRPEYLRSVLAIYHRTLKTFYSKNAKAKNISNPKVGAITVVQRFGGALNLNVHFHTLHTDGVFHKKENGEMTFLEIIPTDEDVKRLVGILKRRINRALIRQENLAVADSAVESIQALSVQNLDENFRLPIPIGKVDDPPFLDFSSSRCHYDDGFSLHAKVKIQGNEREALERLCRYVMRGPVAKERVQNSKDGSVLLKLKTPYLNGTTHLKFTPGQFIKRIISLIPPPRQNLIRYVGVFGARHKMRVEVTALSRPLKKKLKLKKKVYSTPWAELLKHVFKYEVNYCDHCGGKLELIACITSTFVCKKILEHLKIKNEEVIVTSARAPPESNFLDQSCADL